jgi:hypothetical protein
MEWANTLKENDILEKVVAVDGKTVRGSKDPSLSGICKRHPDQ